MAVAVNNDPANVYLAAMTGLMWRAIGVQPIMVLMGPKSEWIEHVALGPQLIDVMQQAELLAIFVAASIPPPGVSLSAFASMATLCSPVMRFLQPTDTVILSFNGMLPIRASYAARLRQLAVETPNGVFLEALPRPPAGNTRELPAPPYLHSQAIAMVDAWRQFLEVDADMTYSDCIARVLSVDLMNDIRLSIRKSVPQNAGDDSSEPPPVTALPSDMAAQLVRYRAKRLPANSGVKVQQIVRDMQGADLRGPPGPWRAAVASAYQSAQPFFQDLLDAWSSATGPYSLAPRTTADARASWAILHGLLQTVMLPGDPLLTSAEGFHAAYVAYLAANQASA